MTNPQSSQFMPFLGLGKEKRLSDKMSEERWSSLSMTDETIIKMVSEAS
jgi:hypothetical protein